jgi:hypothetical protein
MTSLLPDVSRAPSASLTKLPGVTCDGLSDVIRCLVAQGVYYKLTHPALPLSVLQPL